jgi:hypothetical protein
MKKYTIPAGDHFSNHMFHFGITFMNRIRFKAKFDASCVYDLPDSEKTDYNHDYDINKLYGFATTYNLHNQSARIGWRCLDDKTIQILTYTYNDHVRIPETVLGTVNVGEEFECAIEDLETSYAFTFKYNGKTVVARTPKQPDKVLFKFILYPYFGGNFPAPHDMHIYVERL